MKWRFVNLNMAIYNFFVIVIDFPARKAGAFVTGTPFSLFLYLRIRQKFIQGRFASDNHVYFFVTSLMVKNKFSF